MSKDDEYDYLFKGKIYNSATKRLHLYISFKLVFSDKSENQLSIIDT